MNNRERHEWSNVSVIEAVETLTHIADMDEQLLTVAEAPAMESAQEDRTVLWYRQGDQEVPVTEQGIKAIFRTILKYLKSFYQNESSLEPSLQSAEGIKTIMILVGEAAKKLDRQTAIFHPMKGQSVTDLKEYRHLQEFYLNRIASKVDQGVLGKWILGVSQAIFDQKNKIQMRQREHIKEVEQAKHVFVDLDAVKKDSEYELFFILKEDGTRFYNPRLIRNMKLVCDFGTPLGESKAVDPLENIFLWDDNYCRVAAENLLHALKDLPQRFFFKTSHKAYSELKECLSKALMALMISSKPQNQYHDHAIKSCREYFSDFHYFLRQALHSREYQKLLAYPPLPSDFFSCSLIELTHAMCLAFFTQLQGYQALIPQICSLVQKAHQNTAPPAKIESVNAEETVKHLQHDYTLLSKLYRKHQYGPLKKTLDNIEDGLHFGFDPIQQHNLPNQLYALLLPNKKIINFRTPTPTKQEYIHKPAILEEFKAFLYSLKRADVDGKYLFINFQDKTSWKEYFRASLLEELQKHKDFENQLFVATLSKDSEFYYQQGAYQQENHTDIFLENFKENLSDENCGFFFPAEFHKELFLDFIEGALSAVHRIFFANKNVLTREHRLDFIELFYIFLELKLIELSDPTCMSLACKDSLDVGTAANAQLFLFLKILNEPTITVEDREYLNFLLYAPALLVRERLMQPDRFNRLIAALKVIENVRREFGWPNFNKIVNEAFGFLYKVPVLRAQPIRP